MLEYYHIGMGLLEDILKTILGQDEDSANQNEDSVETEVTLDDDELIIEREIIKCQMKHGRLLIQTGKALRRRFQDKDSNGNLVTDYRNQPTSEKVDRGMRRLAKRRYRNNCPVKAQIKEDMRKPNAIIDHYFKEKFKAEYTAL